VTFYVAGDCGHRVWIEDGWRVLDVGSGQSPHPRADVLLEKFPDDNLHRAGDGVDTRDARLVIGDACAMPFADGEFDYVIASHIAEHVVDPAAFCREVARVGRRGYIETPGWAADVLLRESFHVWRVRIRGRGLNFERVFDPRPLGVIADVFYALVYADVRREGHWTPRSRSPLVRRILARVRWVMTRIIWAPRVRERFYMEFEWDGPFDVVVRPPTVPRTPPGSSAP
jgi:hypothetical protein